MTDHINKMLFFEYWEWGEGKSCRGTSLVGVHQIDHFMDRDAIFEKSYCGIYGVYENPCRSKQIVS